jgi:hypothetical protein
MRGGNEMADLTPQPDLGAGPGREEDRERTIESLLVTGLDLYFSGDCERAIHAWTRVLFLDRNHPRARAYIERARTVLGERQRETDELLHQGLAALDAGDTDHARTLLASAIQRGGPVEAAQTALDRLTRLEVTGGAEIASAPEPARVAMPSRLYARPRGRRSARVLVVFGGVLLIVAAVLAFRWQAFDVWGRTLRQPVVTAPTVVPAQPLPYPRVADLAIGRARALFARGHLLEALGQLDAVRPDDPRRPEADRLRADVQRALLATAESSSNATNSPSTSGRP